MAIVVGVFEDYAEAQASVQDLVARGFSSETISAVGRRGGEPDPAPADIDSTGTAIGVGTGAVLGGTLAAMGLAVPESAGSWRRGPGGGPGRRIYRCGGGRCDRRARRHRRAECRGRGVRRGGEVRRDARHRDRGRLAGRHRHGDPSPTSCGRRRGARTVERARASDHGAPSTTSELPRERARLPARDVRRHPAADDADFRRHHATVLGATDAPYEDYARRTPSVATSPPILTTSADWEVMEPEARRQWQERCPGTWDRCRAAIRLRLGSSPTGLARRRRRLRPRSRRPEVRELEARRASR